MKSKQRERGALYRVYTLEEFLAGADARGDLTPMAGAPSPRRGLHRLAGAAALGGAMGAVGSVLALATPQAHPVARATVAPRFIGPRPIARTRAIIRSAGPLRRRSPRSRRARDNSRQLTPRSNRATPRRSDLHTRPLAIAVAASATAAPPASNAAPRASIPVSPASNAAPSASNAAPSASTAAPSSSIPASTVPTATAQAPAPGDTRQTPAEPEPPARAAKRVRVRALRCRADLQREGRA